MKKLIILISLLITFSQSYAGILMKWSNATFKDAKLEKSSTVNMYLEKNKLRVEGKFGDKDKVMIFRLDKNETWILNPEAKTYKIRKKKKPSKTDKKNEELKNKVQNTFQKFLNKVPKKHKGKAENYTNKYAGGLLPESKLNFVQTEKDIEYQGVTGKFARYEAKVKDKLAKMILTLKYKDAEMTKKDMQILYDVSNFVGSAFNEVSDVKFKNDFAQEKGKYKGFPAASYYYDKNGKVKYSRFLNQIENEKLDSQLFEVPKGYKKVR